RRIGDEAGARVESYQGNAVMIGHLDVFCRGRSSVDERHGEDLFLQLPIEAFDGLVRIESVVGHEKAGLSSMDAAFFLVDVFDIRLWARQLILVDALVAAG